MTERQIDVGDVSLAVAESGAGQRPLLLVHGFTGAKEDFTPWLEPLAAAGWHAVAPDLRGHGVSSKPAAESAEAWAPWWNCRRRPPMRPPPRKRSVNEC